MWGILEGNIIFFLKIYFNLVMGILSGNRFIGNSYSCLSEKYFYYT